MILAFDLEIYIMFAPETFQGTLFDCEKQIQIRQLRKMFQVIQIKRKDLIIVKAFNLFDSEVVHLHGCSDKPCNKAKQASFALYSVTGVVNRRPFGCRFSSRVYLCESNETNVRHRAHGNPSEMCAQTT